MKKHKYLAVAAMLCCSLAFSGCGDERGAKSSSPSSSALQTEAAPSGVQAGAKDSKKLVIYFSYLDNVESGNIHSEQYDVMTTASIQVRGGKQLGTSRVIAERIAKDTGADVYSLQQKEKYSTDYDKVTAQGKEEKEANIRPELAGSLPDLSKYDTVFIVYPIWWYDLPMAYYSFFDKADLSGKQVYVVESSGGSGFLDTIDSIKKAELGAKVDEQGLAFEPPQENIESRVDEWLKAKGF